MGRRRKIDSRLVEKEPVSRRASMFMCGKHGCDVGFTETFAPTPEGQKLKEEREARNLTPAQVGRLFGLRYDEIEGLEEGRYSFMNEGVFSSLMATLEGKVPAKPAREESKSVAASRKVILYRGKEFEEEELEAARAAGFFCTNSRMDIRPGDVCIPRYSALPFYEEQERDIHRVGALMLNTKMGHDYCADVMSYAADLGDMTPQTWAQPSDVPQDDPGSFVLKGKTNSKKFLWRTHMFAKDRKAVMEVYSRLLDDTMISQQPIYVRKYVPLWKLGIGEWDLPITREFRFFVLDGKVLSGGFYWASHYEELLERGVAPSLLDPADFPEAFLQKAIERIDNHVRFYAIDVAFTAELEPIVIELNDGQQSGLSMNDPVVLYRNLRKGLEAGCRQEQGER